MIKQNIAATRKNDEREKERKKREEKKNFVCVEFVLGFCALTRSFASIANGVPTKVYN